MPRYTPRPQHPITQPLVRSCIWPPLKPAMQRRVYLKAYFVYKRCPLPAITPLSATLLSLPPAVRPFWQSKCITHCNINLKFCGICGIIELEVYCAYNKYVQQASPPLLSTSTTLYWHLWQLQSCCRRFCHTLGCPSVLQHSNTVTQQQSNTATCWVTLQYLFAPVVIAVVKKVAIVVGVCWQFTSLPTYIHVCAST